MKKYILTTVLVLLGTIACENKQKPEENLASQKEEIEKQIDSLHKLLVEIDNKLGKNKKEEIPEISALTIIPQKFEHYVEIQGNIDTDGNVMLIPEAMGKIKKIYKNEGDKIRKGQIIMILDDNTLRNQIAEVKTQYDLSKTVFDRQKRLWDKKIGSEMAFLQAKTKKDALYRKLVTLNSQLRKMQVRAPISGVIDDMMIKEGEMAMPQRPVARIVNLKKVYMQADVSEKYLPKIKRGSLVNIKFPETGNIIQSTISYVGNFIHPNNRTFKIRINLLNTDNSLKPNLTGNINIKDFEKENVVVLPLSIIQEDRNKNNYVFILTPIKNQKNIFKVKKQTIEVGETYKGKAYIKTGLNPGDLLAMQGTRGLTEGDKVKLNKPIEIIQKTKAEDNLEKKVTIHIVKSGETLFKIHKKYKVSLQKLRKWNHLKGNNIIIGQKLTVSKND